MSFRIWTIFWVFAVVAAAIATFGPGGILAVIIVVAFWALIFYGSKRLSDPIGLPAVLAIVASVLLAVLQAPRIASSQSDQCEDNLKQIAAALKTYSNRYGSFPAA
jgi:membrane protein implicated in regulation of membrane protease activity